MIHGSNTVYRNFPSAHALGPAVENAEKKVDIHHTQVTTATIKLLDMSGRVVQEAKWQASVGLNSVVLNVNQLIAGIYSLQIIQNDQLNQVIRIVKN